jgi:hypothetical protein
MKVQKMITISQSKSSILVNRKLSQAMYGSKSLSALTALGAYSPGVVERRMLVLVLRVVAHIAPTLERSKANEA